MDYPQPNLQQASDNSGKRQRAGISLIHWGEGATLLRKEYTPNKKDTETMDKGHGGPASPADEDNDSHSEDVVLPKSEFAAGHHTPKIFVEPLPIATVRVQAPREHSQTEAHRMDASPLEPGLPTDVDTLADSMSSLALVPPSIHFGRGGARNGLKQPPHMRGMAARGCGRGRGGMY